MKIKKLLVPVLCGVLALSCALLPLATFQTSANYDGDPDEDVLLNPFGGGVVTMDYDVVGNPYKATYDIPETYGYGSFSDIQYNMGDAMTVYEETDIGNVTLTLMPSIGSVEDIRISYVNKLFDVGYMQGGEVPLIAIPDYYPDVTITVWATFIIPVANREVSGWLDPVEAWSVHYEKTFTLTEQQIFTAQSVYGYTLPLYDVFYDVFLTFPELSNESDLLYCSTMNMFFNNVTNLTKVYFLNQTNDSETAPQPYENQFEYNALEMFVAGVEYNGGNSGGGDSGGGDSGGGETPAPAPDTIDTLLAVPVAFLETEFLPNFSFGDLLLILLGFVLFSFALKIGFGG